MKPLGFRFAFSKLNPRFVYTKNPTYENITATNPFPCVRGYLLISACSQNSKNTFDLTAARKGIDEGNKAIMEFIMKSDSVGVSNMYTADAKIMAPGGPAVPKEQIRSFIHTLSVMGIKDFRLKTVDI